MQNGIAAGKLKVSIVIDRATNYLYIIIARSIRKKNSEIV